MAFPTILEEQLEFVVPSSGRRLDGLVERYLSNFETHIGGHKPKEVFRSGDTVSFSGGMFRWVSKANLLVPVQHGSVTATLVSGRLRVAYSLDMSFSAYGNVLMIPVFTWMFARQGLSMIAGLAIGLGVFGLSAASSWWWVRWRFRRVLHRTWEDARPRTTQDVGFPG
ncbi:MAG: hypothetical protein IPM24_13275 [Bryobacterales bacterium]|jgi:hypothetical protein|nr:hypothetical protein [Bryobacterales bacterium]